MERITNCELNIVLHTTNFDDIIIEQREFYK